MSSVIETLWELQSINSELADREQKMNSKPESFAAIDEEYQAAVALLSTLTDRAEVVGKDRRRMESDLQDNQESLKKYQGQLMQVKNQQQYAAAWKEIDGSRKHVKEIEDGLLRSMQEVEDIDRQVAERTEADSGLKASHEAEYKEWQDSLGDLRKEVAEIKSRLAEAEKKVPAPLLRQFQQILKQRQGQAVARVIQDACSGCRFKLRSQALQQLKRGELITCEGCRRFCYLG